MINEFIAYLRDTKGKADNTLVAYKRDVISFAKFLEGHSGRELAECKESDSIAYILELIMQTSQKRRSIANFHHSEHFYDYGIETGEVTENPFSKIKSAKNDKRQIEFLH